MKPASVRSSLSDRHWMTASNGKRHGNGSGRGNKIGTDQRSKRVSHNGSHHHHASSPDFVTSESTPSEASAPLDEIDCLDAFHAVYHELQLIRTVRRPMDLLAESASKSSIGNKKKNFQSATVDQQQMQTLLFLGNIHPQLEQRASYRPTSYQPALVRHQEVSFPSSGAVLN